MQDQTSPVGQTPPPSPSHAPQKADPLAVTLHPQVRYFGNYELIAELGRGGMGIVFKARQKNLDRVVALKMVLSGRFAGERELLRFRAEAEAAAALDHPNIVPIYEVGQHEGWHYYSMKLIAGPNLAQQIGGFREDPKGAVRLMAKIARAIHHAHQRGILHRDIKPSNILLDAEGNPYVADLGLAKHLERDEHLTQSEAVLGTPAYMAPEQASGHSGEATIASDVYSLGAVLYELLAGHPPFKALSASDLLRQLQEKEAPSLRSVNARIDRDLETICQKCLAKEPQQRYDSAGALADDLERWLRHEPIQARPAGAWRRAAKWLRRHAVASAFIATIAILLLAFAVSQRFSVVRISAARNAEAAQRRNAEDAQRQTAATVFRLRMEHVEDLFRSDRSAEGLAELSRLIRDQPDNAVATTRLLSALMHRSFMLPIGEPSQSDGWVHHAAFSPDGREFFTVGGSRMPLFREANYGAPITRPWLGRDVSVFQYHPNDSRRGFAVVAGKAVLVEMANGRVLTPDFGGGPVAQAIIGESGGCVVTAAPNGFIRVLDAQTGQPRGEPFKYDASVERLVLSPNECVLAVCSAGRRLSVRNLQSGESLVDDILTTKLVWLGFTPDSEHLVCIHSSGLSEMLHLPTRTRSRLPFEIRTPMTASMTVDGRYLVTGAKDNTARVWQLPLGMQIGEPLRHRAWVVAAQTGPGHRVLTGAYDRTARLWDAVSGQPLCEPIRHDTSVHAVALSPDGTRLVTGAKDGTTRLWTALPGNALPHTIFDPKGIMDAQFSRDGNFVVTTGMKLGVRDARSGGILRESAAQSQSLGLLRLSSDDLRALTFHGQSGRAHLWDIDRCEMVRDLSRDGPVVWAEFSADGRLVLVATPQGIVRVFDSLTLTLKFGEIEVPGGVALARLSRDARFLATAGPKSGIVQVWSLPDGKCLFKLAGHKSPLMDAQFSPNGELLVTASEDTTAILWDLRTHQPRHAPLKHNWQVWSAQFDRTGERLVTTAWDVATVWDVRTGNPLYSPIRHEDLIAEARFSPDSTRLALGARDFTARVYDVRTGLPLTEPLRHPLQLSTLAFSPDGRWLLTKCWDLRVRIWEIPPACSPAPHWLPALAEAVAGMRLSSQRMIEVLPMESLYAVAPMAAETGNISYNELWRRWFIADRATRSLSPSATITLEEYAAHLAESQESGMLNDALRITPRPIPLLLKAAALSSTPRETARAYHKLAAQLEDANLSGQIRPRDSDR